MKTSHLRNKNESVRMFSNSNKTDSLTVHKFDSTYNFTDVTEASPVITPMNNNHKRYDFQAPDEDCQICAVFNGYPVMFQVGQPEVRFMHYEGKTGETIPFQRIDEDGNDIDAGNLTELGNGFYYHVPTDLGLSIYRVHGKSHIMKVPYLGSSADSLSGSILLQKDKWMLCAVPTDGKIYENFVQYIENKYTVSGADIFEVFNAYPATDSQSAEFLSFVPGVTSPLTKHNFPLKMVDSSSNDEIIGFWIKTKNYAGSELVYDWSIL